LHICQVRAKFALAITADDNDRIGRATTQGRPYKSDSLLRSLRGTSSFAFAQDKLCGYLS
jgi:hypothetical protein